MDEFPKEFGTVVVDGDRLEFEMGIIGIANGHAEIRSILFCREGVSSSRFGGEAADIKAIVNISVRVDFFHRSRMGFREAGFKEATCIDRDIRAEGATHWDAVGLALYVGANAEETVVQVKLYNMFNVGEGHADIFLRLFW